LIAKKKPDPLGTGFLAGWKMYFGVNFSPHLPHTKNPPVWGTIRVEDGVMLPPERKHEPCVDGPQPKTADAFGVNPLFLSIPYENKFLTA
jgi:hypothetical protein